MQNRPAYGPFGFRDRRVQPRRARAPTAERAKTSPGGIQMDGTLGRVVFEAAHREARTTIFWHLDGEYQGRTRDIHRWRWHRPPVPTS